MNDFLEWKHLDVDIIGKNVYCQDMLPTRHPVKDELIHYKGYLCKVLIGYVSCFGSFVTVIRKSKRNEISSTKKVKYKSARDIIINGDLEDMYNITKPDSNIKVSKAIVSDFYYDGYRPLPGYIGEEYYHFINPKDNVNIGDIIKFGEFDARVIEQHGIMKYYYKVRII